MTLTILSLGRADVRDARAIWSSSGTVRLGSPGTSCCVGRDRRIVEMRTSWPWFCPDHRLPGKSGMNFLVELMQDERFSDRTVLVTGRADQSGDSRRQPGGRTNTSAKTDGTRRSCEPPCGNQLTEVRPGGRRVDPCPTYDVSMAMRVMGDPLAAQTGAATRSPTRGGRQRPLLMRAARSTWPGAAGASRGRGGLGCCSVGLLILVDAERARFMRTRTYTVFGEGRELR